MPKRDGGKDRKDGYTKNSKSENHMAIERVRAYLEQYGARTGAGVRRVERHGRAGGRSTGVRTQPDRRLLSFGVGEGISAVVTAGDCKIDNAKYKARNSMPRPGC